jgi:hypothetical protein
MKNRIKKLVKSIIIRFKGYEDDVIAIVHARGVLIK